jgi:hypothetical protein
MSTTTENQPDVKPRVGETYYYQKRAVEVIHEPDTFDRVSVFERPTKIHPKGRLYTIKVGSLRRVA